MPIRLTMTAAIAAFACVAGAPALGAEFATGKLAIDVETVADGLDHPWGVAMLPDGSLLVTERAGRLLRIVDGQAKPVEGVPDVFARRQGGLLDIAVDDEFATSRRIWFTFSEPGRGGASTALATATISPDYARLEGVTVLFSMARKTRVAIHFGSRVVLAPEGKLFMTTGDRGEGPRAQDFSDSAGAVLRLNRDGSVPEDNPFAEKADALPQLWSKGHRNVQGAAWDRERQMLWTVEHGAKGGDEINAPQAGLNYGWPVITYGRNYNDRKIGIGQAADGLEQPLHYWDPSIAPSGLAVYYGELFPQWRGDLLVGALVDQSLVRLHVEDRKIVSEERMLGGEFGRIRDVKVLADGAVWLLTDEDDGKLLRITPADD